MEDWWSVWDHATGAYRGRWWGRTGFDAVARMMGVEDMGALGEKSRWYTRRWNEGDHKIPMPRTPLGHTIGKNFPDYIVWSNGK